MSSAKKLLEAAAGNAGGAGLDVAEVFSTFLYTGTGSNQTITNGIDLSGEGGLVWSKARSATKNNAFVDTVRGSNKYLESNTTVVQGTAANIVTAFNSNGYTAGNGGYAGENGTDYASWTFRKAKKFFDIVTYTGNVTSSRGIAHNLGSVPGMIIIKRSDGTSNWIVYHSGLDSVSPEDYYFYLDATNARIPDVTMWDSTAPTDTVFTVGNDNAVNGGGSKTYVAYLFAHNDGDGEFGPDADQDIISCGSYTGDGGAGTTEINLGWQPQFVIIKASSAADNWWMFDTMRGIVTDPNGANDATLYPNEAYAESDNGAIDLTATGFKTTLFSNVNVNGRTYVYMAIRAPMITEPEAATEVFANSKQSKNTTGFPVDMFIYKGVNGSDSHVYSRLTGGTKYQEANNTGAERTSSDYGFDDMEGTKLDGWGTNFIFWNWKRAKGYFDVTTWAVDGTNNQTINHNLGVIPEMV